MPKRLAIVTGANKGIGYHCVEQLRDALPAADADVLLTSRNEALGLAAAKAVRQACGGGAGAILYQQCDIADEASVEKLRAWVEREYGGVDLLVNNAGATSPTLPPPPTRPPPPDACDGDGRQALRTRARARTCPSASRPPTPSRSTTSGCASSARTTPHHVAG